MSLCTKRKKSSRPQKPPMDPELRAQLEQNPHTRLKPARAGVPWTNCGRSRLGGPGDRRTSGHVAGGSMIGGS